jgi:hypothetical protein
MGDSNPKGSNMRRKQFQTSYRFVSITSDHRRLKGAVQRIGESDVLIWILLIGLEAASIGSLFINLNP